MRFADDPSAMAAVVAGEAQAIDHLYERYGRLVHAVAYRICGDAALAEECTQDAFVALWRRAETFDPARGSLPAWLLAIARNVSLTAVRRRRPTVELDQDDEISPDRAPEELVVAADAATSLANAMAVLPEPQLEVLQLLYFDGLTQAEVAERLALPLGTVKGRVRLALDRLRALVGDGAAVRGR
jgi:RNA polymerase sigma-70 factor (ECF subfamily)